MQIFFFSAVIIIQLSRIERAGEWVLNHNFRSIHSGVGIFQRCLWFGFILFWWESISYARLYLSAASLSLWWCFLCFNSVISLHSHNQFSTVQNVNTYTQKHTHQSDIISKVYLSFRIWTKPNESFPSLCVQLFLFSRLTLYLPLYCSHVHVILREGGVELPWPKFATWQQEKRTPIKSSLSLFK